MGDGWGLDFIDPSNRIFESEMQACNQGPIRGGIVDDGNSDFASVADPSTGKLLFYSNGGTCWDRNHRPMPNGFGLWGNSVSDATHNPNVDTNVPAQYSSRQGALIAPVIGKSDQYYLFSIGNTLGAAFNQLSSVGLYYSIVDMNLNQGLGDIVPGKKNVLLTSGLLGGSIIAIPGSNCDVWLMMHPFDSAIFKAYQITESGIDTTAVVSHAGSQLRGPVRGDDGSYTRCYMAASPDRTKLALTAFGFKASDFIVTGVFADSVWGTLLSDFEPATGKVSNSLLIDQSVTSKVCFSPDNSKLYLDTKTPSRTIVQFDISVMNAATIAATKTMVRNDSTVMLSLQCRKISTEAPILYFSLY